jgi:hypothetical protein
MQGVISVVEPKWHDTIKGYTNWGGCQIGDAIPVILEDT